MNTFLEEFKRKISKLPKNEQIRIVKKLTDLVYEDFDESIFRVMATSIKFAKENKIEGYEDINIHDKELEKLTHIQDGNRLLQKKRGI